MALSLLQHSSAAETELLVTTTCLKCGGPMERGVTMPVAFKEGQLFFVVTSTLPSRNPVKAFKQGLAGEPDTRRYQLVGVRCSSCGFVELYGDGDPVA
jgi:hypothetical protein